MSTTQKKSPTKHCCQCGKPRATHRVLVVGVGIRFMCRRCCNALGAKKAMSATGHLSEADVVAALSNQDLLPGKRCPTCRKVVETTQRLIPLEPEIAVCEPCKSRWSDGVCVKWHGWWLV